MTSNLPSILPVWLAAVVGAVLVGVLSHPTDYFTGLSLVLAAGTLLTFIVQLALRSKEGLVLRVMASIGGVIGILAVATAVLAPLSA
ncbi:hypothetical protein [Galbitalea soli]|uniref:Uncharacterized protein n=1 Tax=Galbitalea soli TaxID=1268042 RepID=A0A7C9PPG4_9MICO|nr:hypothetical protein [Galbitalea soli]NEM92325.1 hypothetical protein [Galbitalea soli]NYJ31719.1 C4-dicarboxylate transporter [Galbitalea soli]